MDPQYPDDSDEPLMENPRNKRKCSFPTEKSNRPSMDLTRSSRLGRLPLEYLSRSKTSSRKATPAGEKVVDRGPARYFLSLLHETTPLVETQMDLEESLFEQPKAVTDSGGEQLGSSEREDDKLKAKDKELKSLQHKLARVKQDAKTKYE